VTYPAEVHPPRSNLPLPLVSLTVAVLTYLRPQQLRRGLPVIVEQVRAINADGLVRARVLIVDNDAAGSAKLFVSGFDTSLVQYVVEAEPGIAAARNRALDETVSSDLLVYIDDDECPAADWLRPLVETWRSSQAAAVMGRVVPEFASDLDPWVAAGHFFRRRSMRTGTEILVAATNNLLLDLKQVHSLRLRFDVRLGLCGGEDSLFSHQLTRGNARIVWCEESAATDFVPAERSGRRWVLMRAFSHGNTASLVAILLAETVGQRLIIRVQQTIRGLNRIGGGCGRNVFGLATRSLRHEARGLRAVCRGAGMVAGAWGYAYREYARPAAIVAR